MVLDFSNPTTNTMTTITNDNLSVYIANTSVANKGSFFGAFQQMTVGSSNVTIRTIVPLSISAEPYRKAIVAILFFRRILVIWLQW